MKEIDVTFTKEEREYIDKLVEEADEMQKQPGSRYYTMDEIWGELLEKFNKDIQSYNR